MSLKAKDVTDRQYRNWWVWVNEGQDRGGEWHSVGDFGGYRTADEAIQAAIRHYDHPVWAFALDKGPYGAYYNLHYPEGVECHGPPTRVDFAPSGYRAALGEDLSEGDLCTETRISCPQNAPTTGEAS